MICGMDSVRVGCLPYSTILISKNAHAFCTTSCESDGIWSIAAFTRGVNRCEFVSSLGCNVACLEIIPRSVYGKGVMWRIRRGLCEVGSTEWVWNWCLSEWVRSWCLSEWVWNW